MRASKPVWMSPNSSAIGPVNDISRPIVIEFFVTPGALSPPPPAPLGLPPDPPQAASARMHAASIAGPVDLSAERLRPAERRRVLVVRSVVPIRYLLFCSRPDSGCVELRSLSNLGGVQGSVGGHVDVVDLGGVPAEQFDPDVPGDVVLAEYLGDAVERLRVQAGRVGEVRLEHAVVHAEAVDVVEELALGLEPEAGVDLTAEVVRGLH